MTVDCSTALKTIIKDKVLKNKEAFERMGANGRDYYMRNILDECIDHLKIIIGFEK